MNKNDIYFDGHNFIVWYSTDWFKLKEDVDPKKFTSPKRAYNEICCLSNHGDNAVVRVLKWTGKAYKQDV